MTNLDFTIDFIRKSPVIRDGLVHAADNIIPTLGRKKLPELGRKLSKFGILTFWGDNNIVLFVRETNNPYLHVERKDGYVSGYYVRDHQVVILRPSKYSF